MPNPDKPDYTHGSTGQKPSQARDYQNGDRLDADNLDYFINTPFEKIKAIIDTLVTIDSDGDGVVDRADSAVTADSADAYKSNDIDSDGDGKVNSADQADNATTVKGNDIDSDGDGKVDSAESADSATTATDATNVTSTYKGNDIDSDGDGKVDNADKIDGQEASDLKPTKADFIYAAVASSSESFKRYDISSDTWSNIADETQSGGIVSDDGENGYLYAIDANGSSFIRYDPAADSWTNLSNYGDNGSDLCRDSLN